MTIEAPRHEAPGFAAAVAPPSAAGARPWASWVAQLLILVLLGLVVASLVDLTRTNLADRSITTGFGFLGDRAGFAIGETLIDYAASDTFARAILVGLLNTLLVSALAVTISTILGFVVGLARLSNNWLLALIASTYVEIVRNLPLLLQLFVWYALFLLGLPNVGEAEPGIFGITFTNRAIYLPFVEHGGALVIGLLAAALVGIATAWLLRPALRQQVGILRHVPIAVAALAALAVVISLIGVPQLSAPRMGEFTFSASGELSTEFLTLVIGLSVYTSAYIGEIVRGGIAAVPGGQREAGDALGLSPWQRVRHIVLPQAMRVILPPMTSWHLNTIKNSSLAVAIGYPEIVSIIDSVISQTGQAIEGVALIVVTFLGISLLLSSALNLSASRQRWTLATVGSLGRAPSTAERPDLSSGRAFAAWARRNLFCTWPQTVVTLVLLVVVGNLIWSVVHWTVIGSIVQGTPAACRQAEGACWLFIVENHRLIVFGTYPETEQWRAALVCTLFVGALAASFHRALWSWALLAIWSSALIASLILMSGGIFGLPHVPTDKWSGLPVTLLLAAIAVFGAFPLAVLLALGRRSSLPVLRSLCAGFIEVVRGVPLIGILFMAAVMFPLFMPDWLDIDSLLRVQIALVLFTAAYMAEAVRGGLLAVPLGQGEAAAALGMTRWQALRYITLPQALKASIPGIVSTAISEVKNTTLVLIVGIFDLLQTTRMSFVEVQWRPFYVEAYVFTGAIFFVLCFTLSRLSQRVERHLARGNQ